MEDINTFKHCGLSYTLDPAVGKGYYWVFPVDNLYAIAVCDLIFKHDLPIQYKHPAFLSIGCYEPSIAKLICADAASYGESLLGYVGCEDAVYKQTFQKNIPIRSIGISLTPEFYEEFLPGRYAGNFRELINIFSRLNGGSTIPEVAMVLKQIRTFQPSSGFSKMYYESKVMEIISLLMQWGKNQLFFPATGSIPDWELERLHEVSSYIGRNYMREVSLNALAKIACMSQNKLTGSFKQVYGLTITEYIQKLRIETAKELLLNSSRSIGEVANTVGYKLHGSFSETFKRATGFTPNNFRRQV